MAKRETPEVNAGSMADIAFLLLIFFLVTTTMVKDVAYLRTIPKKVETEKPPSEIQDKNVYKITINSRNAISARDSIVHAEDVESLNKSIKNFYTINRGKKTDRATNFPYYAYGTKQLYEANIEQQENRLEALERQRDREESPSKELDSKISQAESAIAQWREKLKMVNMYTKYSGKKELPEIAFETHIRLESFNDTDYGAYIAVVSEVKKAVTELRDKESEMLFNKSYTSMEQYVQQNALEDSPTKRQYEEYMELIETLFPLKLIEVKPKH